MLRPKGKHKLILSMSLACFLLSSSIVSSFMVAGRNALATPDGETAEGGGDGDSTGEQGNGGVQQGEGPSQDHSEGKEQQTEELQQDGTSESTVNDGKIPSFSPPADSDDVPSSDPSVPSFSPLSGHGSEESTGATESPSLETGMGGDTFQNMGPTPMSPSPSPAPPPFDPMSPAPPPQSGDTDPTKLCETSAGRALLADPLICDSLGIVPIDQPPPVELCNDGLDNDGDAQVDADDPDCQQQQASLTPPPQAAPPTVEPPTVEPPTVEPPVVQQMNPPVEPPTVEPPVVQQMNPPVEPPIEQPPPPPPPPNRVPVAVAKVTTPVARTYDIVDLDGMSSHDPDGDDLSYKWIQVSNVPIQLANDWGVLPTFTVPPGIKTPTTLTFQLVVNDGKGGSNQDTVKVKVCPDLVVKSLNTYPEHKAEIDPSTNTGCNYSRVDVRGTTAGTGTGNPLSGHLFIVYTDKDGDEFVYRGGPGGDWSTSNPLDYSTGSIMVGQMVSGQIVVGGRYDEKLSQRDTGGPPPDWDPGASSVTVLEGKAAQGIDKCFDSVSEIINTAQYDYEAEGPNSNTVIRTLLVQCGVPANKPDGSFIGWAEVLYHSQLSNPIVD